MTTMGIMRAMIMEMTKTRMMKTMKTMKLMKWTCPDKIWMSYIYLDSIHHMLHITPATVAVLVVETGVGRRVGAVLQHRFLQLQAVHWLQRQRSLGATKRQNHPGQMALPSIAAVLRQILSMGLWNWGAGMPPTAYAVLVKPIVLLTSDTW